MPDKSDYTKRAHPAGLLRGPSLGSKPRHSTLPRRFAELRCKSNFSLLRGASHPEELVERAAELNYAALAITDRHTLAGVVRMHCAAKACHLKLIVGAEFAPTDAGPITLYATDRASYGRLARIITQGRLRTAKGSCLITVDDIAEWSQGLLATMYGGESNSGSPRGLKLQTRTRVPPARDGYRDIFGDRLYLAVSAHGNADDERHLAEMNDLSRATGVPLVATNDVHYHEPKRRFLQDVLTCIRQRCTLRHAGRRLFANAERHLKTIADIERIFANYPQAVAHTTEIADRCNFSLDELRYEYPKAICPADKTPANFLTQLTWSGARQRYPAGVPEKVRTLIEHELTLIKELAYEPYFLTVWDIVKFARSRNILCQGRGSAANSAVCYCLGITSVDPDKADLLFERFVSAERNEPPDIDVDFEHERREEVFQYIYNKYGREHAAIVGEVITYRPRSAIRDIGKALGLSLDRVALLAKKHEWWDKHPLPDEVIGDAGLDPADRTMRMLARLVRQMIGFPRHLSQHVGGFVITRGPLCEMVPLQNGAMPNRTFIEWDKDDIDALGILKIDCLALGMLTAIQKSFEMINRRFPRDNGSSSGDSPTNAAPLALHTVPPEDSAVYDMICHADTVGVFQVESRAQMSMLPRLKPRCYYDLVIEVAIVRPGPIQGGMVHPYLRRRCGEEAVSYPSEAIKEVLHRTLGVPLFQEQAMKLAVVAAGFTPGEADQLRRAMGAWRKTGDITRFKTKLVEGMKANGLAEEFAQRCFQQICGFGEYGFPESHAASFAQLVYVSCWLKRYHPAVFCAALLNSQPLGFYQPAQLVRDAREHGVDIRPIDINASGYDCRLEEVDTVLTDHPRRSTDPANWGRRGPAVRLGMRLIKGISQSQVDLIERAQRERPFTSVMDLAQRSKASRATLARLAAADAMQLLKLSRREAVWQVLALGDQPPLFEHDQPSEPEPRLPHPTLDETVYADYGSTGLSLNAHPIALIRKELRQLQVQQARVLKHARHGQWLRVAGLVLVRQRPSTALGVIFCTLEDETGTANLIIRPTIYDRFRKEATGAIALITEGRVERQGEVAHLQTARIEDLSHALDQLRSVSRDFH